ncbi:Crp/Fnr family transcriptional regulator [Sphingobacterium sp. MYb382]|uniref:Crp/Fnr family transcriptional regulator n=1 Tax=Sphingobacterium sp. MYb382 TaxID=2745278 RepID=UPI003097EC49
MAAIKEVLRQHFGELSDAELAIILPFFKDEKLRKHDFFSKQGSICNRLSIIKTGIFRVYAPAEDREITQWIATADSFITDAMGFFFDQPNRWNIQAFTDVELLSLHKEDYEKISEVFPRWPAIEKQFIIKCFAMMESRVFSHLSMNAEERYEAYFEHNKELFNQVPLHYIASVLGMSPETFSRIRKRQIEKSLIKVKG